MNKLGTTVPPLVTHAGVRVRNQKLLVIGIAALCLCVALLYLAWQAVGQKPREPHKPIAGLTKPEDHTPARSPLAKDPPVPTDKSTVPADTANGNPGTTPPDKAPAHPSSPQDSHSNEPGIPTGFVAGGVGSPESPYGFQQPRPATAAELLAKDREAAMKSSGFPPSQQEEQTRDRESREPDPRRPLAVPPVPPREGYLETPRISPADYDHQNQQDEKTRFAGMSDPESGNLPIVAFRHKAVPTEGKCIVWRGSSIQGEIISAVSTNLPGIVRARVRRNVWGSGAEDCLAVPQNSVLIGHYNSHVTYAQERVQMVWDTLIPPSEEPIPLHGMSSGETDGSAGVKGKRNQHLRRLIGGVLLSTVLAVGVQVGTNRGSSGSNSGGYYGPSLGDSAAQGVALQMGEFGRKLTEKNLNVPTEIAPPLGALFEIPLSSDLIFITEGTHEGPK